MTWGLLVKTSACLLAETLFSPARFSRIRRLKTFQHFRNLFGNFRGSVIASRAHDLSRFKPIFEGC